MFEHRTSGLIPRAQYIRRVASGIGLASLLVAASLLFGMWGYSHFEGFSAIDAFANASMILSGMGPLTPVTTTGGKLFAGFYALYSGLALVAAIGIIVAPIFHRFLHRFHLEVEEEDRED